MVFYSWTWSIVFSVLTCQLLSCFTQSITDEYEYEIVPDVITNAPSEIIKVSYPNGISVNLGNELTPTQIKYEPSINWTADPNAFYTLCMTGFSDPDAPSRKEHMLREWHHWLIGNIPGNNISKGQILSEYIGSGPPLGTGLHRYVYVVYKQPSKLRFSKPYLTSRSGGQFSIVKFAVKYNLGKPVAGNFYQAQYHDYVPFFRHKQPTA